eukprot:s1286_g8.t1
MVLYKVDTMPSNPTADFQVLPETVVLPLLQDDEPTIRVIEMFSGGFGGWKDACNHLQSCHNLVFSTLALEIDREAAFAYAIAHRVPLVNGWKRINPDIAREYKDLIVHTDLTGDTWLELGSAWKPDIIVISAPCPPWSQAGSAAGLHSDQGQLIVKAIAICKLLRPRMIALEQVGAVTTHEHFRFLMQTLRWAGYCVHHAHTIDASDILPIHRARWLAIALRVEDSSNEAVPFQSWISTKTQVPNTWNVVLPDELLVDAQLFPDEHVLALSARHDLLPPSKRRLVAKNMVLRSRCTDGSEKIQTLVASYGTQHCFSGSWLEERGLLNHFMNHPVKGPRYWHPIELWMMHATQGQFFIHKKWDVAFRHLGNQICTPHALLTLANAVNCLQKVSHKIPVANMIADFISNRVQLSNLHTCHTAVGMLVAGTPIALTSVQIKNIEEFHLGLHEDSVPHGLTWSIDGFLPIVTPVPVNSDMMPFSPSPTMSFVPFQKLKICVDGCMFEAWVHHSISDDQLMKVWDGVFCPLLLQDMVNPEDRIMVPADSWIKSAAIEHDLLTVVANHELFITPPSPEAFQWFNEVGTGTLVNSFGRLISPNSKGEVITCGFSLAQTPPPAGNFAKYVAALQKCHIQVHCKHHLCQVSIFIQGPQSMQNVVRDFWQSLFTREDLDLLGLCLRVEIRGNISVMTWSAMPSCPLPVHSIQVLMLIRAFRSALESLKNPQGRMIRIKIFAQELWSGSLPENLTIATLKQCLHSVSWILVDKAQFRTICYGRQPSDDACIAQQHDLKPDKPCTFHFVLQLQGGGPGNGTKQGHRTQIKNALAAALLDEGFDLAWTSRSVEQAMTQVGMKELSKILQVDLSSRCQLVCSFLRQCSIDIPKINQAKSSQAASQAKKKRVEIMPNPENYRAVDGVLKNENDQHTAYLPKFGGHLNGYHFTTPHAAAPWLKQGEILSKDELALIVFGDLIEDTKLPHSQVTIPCVDEQGRQVLVAGVLVQCGDKKVALNAGDGHQIAADGTILTAVTWRKTDWPEQWQEICNNPYKALRNFPGVSDLLVSVWGKSYRNKRSVATATSADSVQVHCLMKEDQFGPFLKLSGFNLLWLSPKTKEGKPHPDWKIIWLDSTVDLQAATVLATKISDSAGLISQNAKLALRVPKTSYAAAWAQLFPNTPVPDDVDTSRIFKVESLPYGVTSKMMSEWAGHNSWKLRPLRALGPRAWRQDHAIQPSNYVNGFFQTDPWGSWTGPKPVVSATNNASVPVAPTNIGPTEQQFASQSDRLSKLENAVQAIQQGADQQAKAFESLQLDSKKRDADNRAHFEGRLSTIKKELDSSLAAALQQQSKQFAANFDEIKNMLRQKPKRKNAEAGEDAEMSDRS